MDCCTSYLPTSVKCLPSLHKLNVEWLEKICTIHVDKVATYKALGFRKKKLKNLLILKALAKPLFPNLINYLA